MATKLLLFVYVVLLSCLNCHGIVEAYEYIAEKPADICCDEETEKENGCHCSDIAATLQLEVTDPEDETPDINPNEPFAESGFGYTASIVRNLDITFKRKAIPHSVISTVPRHIKSTILRL